MADPIVIDNGTGLIKVGIADPDEAPKMFQTLVGRPNGNSDKGMLIGDQISECKESLKVTYPISRGIVEDWDDMEKVWAHALKKVPNYKKGQHPILITECANNAQSNRGKAAEIFFEKFGAPAFYVQLQATLSLYAGGRLTGVVLDSGDGVTSAVPIYEGYALKHAIQRSDIAGRDITEYLQMLLRKGGYNFEMSMDMEVVKKIKEKRCYFSLDIDKDEEDYREFDQVQFKLPDGNKVINIGPEKFRAPEILFQPSLIGLECDGIQDCLFRAITESDMDIRNILCKNITFAGGCTKLQNFGDRMLQELQGMEMTSGNKIKIYVPHSRLTTAFLGGAIFATLPAFEDMWITKKEWKESGMNAVYKKCR